MPRSILPVRPPRRQRTTLLIAAAASGHKAAVEYAITLDPEVNAVTQNKQTPLHAALSASLQTTTMDDIYQTAQFLLEKGADPNAADATGRTPAAMAKTVAGGRLADLFAKPAR